MRKEIRKRILLGYGILYAMRRRSKAANPPPRLGLLVQKPRTSRPREVPHRVLGPKMVQISILGALVALGLSWWRLGSVFGAFWDRLERLLGPNLGSKTEPTWAKNRSKNRSFFGRFLESIFGWILLGFGSQGGIKLVPKWDQKSISPKTRKNAFGASPLVPDSVQRVQVGSKNRSKIDPKMEPKMEYIFASIFDTFEWILGGKLGGQMDQKSIQKGIGKRH